MGFLKKIGKAVEKGIKKVGKTVGKVANSHLDLFTGGQFSKYTKASSYFEGHQDKLLAGSLAAIAAAGGLAAAGGAGSLFGTTAAAEGAAGVGTGAAAGTAGVGTAEAAAGTAAAGGIASGLWSNLVDGIGKGASNFLGGLLNTGLGLGANYLTSQDELKKQVELQDRAFNYNTEMWNKQNAYNAPAAQMERYRAAGLNPNLIYGNGVSSAGNASGAPQYEAPRYKGMDMSSILSFQSMANLMQQNELLERQKQLAEVQTIAQGMNVEYLPDKLLADIDVAHANARRTNAEADSIEHGDNNHVATLGYWRKGIVPIFKKMEEWAEQTKNRKLAEAARKGIKVFNDIDNGLIE